MDPKEYYNKINGNKEIKETIEDTKKVKEMIDEIYDESFDEQTETVTFTTSLTDDESISANKMVIYDDIPVYESEEDAYNNLPLDRGYYVVAAKRYLVREVPTIKVRYHKELCPDLIEMKKTDKGDFIDLRAAENVDLRPGEFKLISLGISIQLPKGYHAEVVPRSSTFKNFGIIMANSIGIIDESYCGDNDIWRFPALAMRSAHIEINDRICQFRIVKNRNLNIEVVDKLENEDRGGIGSTGKN
jgi:dUTP pyrophosphatase